MFCNNKSYEYDFCNINESKAAYYIFKNILDYYNINTNDSLECLISNKNFINYVQRFNLLENINLNSYSQFRCPVCDRKFKSKNFLNMHYKLFHISKGNNTDNNNTKEYCPADFCKFVNCDRYKKYLGLSNADTKDMSATNRQPRENLQECNKELIQFYKKNCMRMIVNCLGELEDEHTRDKYFEFYTNFCMKIKCNRNDPDYKSNKEELQQEDGVFNALRLIALYIVSIFIIIYLLIIWITKSS